jgi:2-keto-3-deoxy-L-rhamnonate aldolase RhmA
MKSKHSVVGTIAACLSVAAMAVSLLGQEPAPAVPYNTVKTKLASGQQVFGGTVSIADPDVCCAVANAGFDFTWIEMQHSPLSFPDVARMLMACRGAAAIPFIRVPDATEGDIQKATDVGALGIIVPMVDTIEKIEAAVRFAKYPPIGRRSQGGGQYGTLWGNGYRQTANDNIMVVAMLENPAGIDLADRIAAVPGVDVVFVASTDLSSFSGLPQGDAQYEAMVTRAQTAILGAGRVVGGPAAWRNRTGYLFFQGPGEAALIRCGARVGLGLKPTGCPAGPIAETEGTEPRR